MIVGLSLTFCIAEAIWNSLNVDVNLCRSMYKSFVELNGRDFPMMLGEHHLVLYTTLLFKKIFYKNVEVEIYEIVRIF